MKLILIIYEFQGCIILKNKTIIDTKILIKNINLVNEVNSNNLSISRMHNPKK